MTPAKRLMILGASLAPPSPAPSQDDDPRHEAGREPVPGDDQFGTACDDSPVLSQRQESLSPALRTGTPSRDGRPANPAEGPGDATLTGNSRCVRR